MRFELVINLGNDAMNTAEDVAEALRATATHLEVQYSELDPTLKGVIHDANGNQVGRWESMNMNSEIIITGREEWSTGIIPQIKALRSVTDPVMSLRDAKDIIMTANQVEHRVVVHGDAATAIAILEYAGVICRAATV